MIMHVPLEEKTFVSELVACKNVAETVFISVAFTKRYGSDTTPQHTSLKITAH